ncbi:hypothetical protein [Gymnodinialimonas sp.]
MKSIALVPSIKELTPVGAEAVFVDRDAISLVANLKAPSEGPAATVTVNKKVEGYEWLSAILVDPRGSERYATVIEPGQQCELKLRSNVTLTDAQIDQLLRNPRVLDVATQISFGDEGAPVDIDFRLASPSFVTTVLPAPVFEAIEPPDTRVNQLDILRGGDKSLGFLKVTIPESPLQYAVSGPTGPTRNVPELSVDAFLTRTNDVKGMTGSQPQNVSVEVVPNNKSRTSPSPTIIQLKPRSEYVFEARAKMTELSPDTDGRVVLRLQWRIEDGVNGVGGQASSRLAADQRIELIQKESDILQVQLEGCTTVSPSGPKEVLTPIMLPGDILEAVRSEQSFQIRADNGDSAEQRVRLAIWLYRHEMPAVTVHAAIGFADAADIPEAQKVAVEKSFLRAAPLDPLHFDFGLDELLLKADLKEARNGMELRFDISASTENGVHPKKAYSGRITVPVLAPDIAKEFSACLDLGASATTFSFGRANGLGRSGTVPLGDFVYSLAGQPFADYNQDTPGKNALLPMDIGLSSHIGLRNQADPLSLGTLDRLGGSEDAIRNRLTHFDRTYDVSLPGPKVGAHEQQLPFVNDLKRRLLSKGKMPMSPEVFAHTKDGLSLVSEIDLYVLLRDVFDEIAVYLIPRAMLLSKDLGHDEVYLGGVSTSGVDTYKEFNELNASNLDLVITHPTRLDKKLLREFKDAGRHFFRQLIAEGNAEEKCEPIFVSEALAAAHYCIYAGVAEEVRKSYAGRTTNLAVIDIGASTFDAIIVSVDWGSAGIAKSWEVKSHFGERVGGHNLDDALRSIALQALDAELDPTDPNGLRLDDDYARSEIRLSDALDRAIQNAKISLCDAVRSATRPGPYRWEGSLLPQSLNVSLRGILLPPQVGSASRHKPRQAAHDAPHVVYDAEARHFVLRIPRDILLAHNDVNTENAEQWKRPSPRNPAMVARLLGVGIPAMMAREAERLSVRDVEWVITGRTALWPPIYQAVLDTISSLGGGNVRSPQPFEPNEMKEVVVHGARAFPQSALTLTEDQIYTVAVISEDAIPRSNDQGYRILPIMEVTYLDDQRTRLIGDGDEFEIKSQGHLKLALAKPGLHKKGEGSAITLAEIQGLFDMFGLDIYESAQELPANSHENLVVQTEKRFGGVLYKFGTVSHFIGPNRPGDR